MWKRIFIIIILFWGLSGLFSLVFPCVVGLNCNTPLPAQAGLTPRPNMVELGRSLKRGIEAAKAAETGSVVINEIAWMGNENSSADEWIELYNNTDEEIDLTGWKLTAQDGKPDIALEGCIPAKGYFLIERTDDDSAPNVSANLIASFGTGLGNNGEVLELYDNDGYLIDSTPLVDGENGWAAGDNENKFTMERIDVIGYGDDVLNWQTSAEAGGTPRNKNSEGANLEGEDNKDGEEVEREEVLKEGVEVIEVKEGGDDLKVKEIENFEVGKEEKKEEKVDKKSINTSLNGGTVKKGAVVAGKIVINEIFPNPKGVDFGKEFIELKNIGGQEVNVGGWIIKNKENQYTILKDDFLVTIIPAGGFFLLSRNITNIALNNSDDKIEIFSGNGKREDYIVYNEYAGENESYSKINDKWQWSMAITSGFENFYIVPNRAPQAVIDAKGITEISSGGEIIFDGSDSFDPDGDDLSFFWKTSDGVEEKGAILKKRFSLPGEYKINLKTVDNFLNENSVELKIKVLKDFWGTNYNFDAISSVVYKEQWGDIEVVEVLPNPAGSDVDGEWIKIFNNEVYPLNMGDWVLDDEDGGSSPYYIPADVNVGAKSFFVFERAKTGIALNNDGDEARLFSPDGEIRSEIIYSKVSEGEIVKNGKIGEGEPASANLSAQAGATAGEGEGEIKKLEIGNWELEKYEEKEISVDGYVSVKPGILGKQIFYLTDGTKGMEIYSWAKDFPEIERGDRISVFGELENKDGWRISMKTINDIKILSYEHPPLAVEKNIGDIKMEDIHSLIMVKGQVVEKSSPNLYIDDGNNEIKVYVMASTDILIKEINVGDNISIVGILDYLNGSYRLLPRDKEDIKLQEGRVLGENEISSVGKVSVANSGGKDIREDSSSNQKRKKVMIYLSVSLVTLLIVGWVVWRRR